MVKYLKKKNGYNFRENLEGHDCHLERAGALAFAMGLFSFSMTPEGGTRTNRKNYLAITSAPKQNRLICEIGNSSTQEEYSFGR